MQELERHYQDHDSMKFDPVLSQLHKIKDDIAKSCGYDLNRLCEMLRKTEKTRPNKFKKPDVKAQARIVKLLSTPPSRARKASAARA